MEVLEGVGSLFICNLLVFDEEELPLGLDLLWGLTDDDGPASALELEGFR
jgi:hypothetical protein